MKKLILGLGLCTVGFFAHAQNGLEQLIVEKYYVANAADAAGSLGALPVGSVTYRIYADMLPGYKFQMAYGSATHALVINTSTSFFNNEDRGATTPTYTKTQAKSNTVMLDSWLSVGAGCSGNMGVLKSEDDGIATVVNSNGILQSTDPSVGSPLTSQDGLISVAPQLVTFVGINATQLSVFDATSQVGNSFIVNNGSWAALSTGVSGPTVANRVLIAQITTDGVFHYELNIQIKTPIGDIEKYVTSNPLPAERTIPSLTGTLGGAPANASTWIGVGSANSWLDATNWNNGVPGAATSVIISGGLNNYPTLTTPVSCSGILINSGASLLDNGNLTVSGTSTVERSIVGGEWHLISAPVSNAFSAMFLGKYLQKHSELTNAYTDITNSGTPLTAMKGFAIYDAATFTAQYNGLLNTGSKSIALTRTAPGIGSGWNLVGNPYPSSIDWDALSGWSKANVNNAIYSHVNSSTWASYVGGVSANGGSRYIGAGQGFFVQVANGSSTGSLGMNNAVRVHNATPFFKNSVSNLVRVQISGNGYSDEAVVRFLPEATAEFDGDFDANKLFGDVAEAPQVYSLGSTPMAINTLPETSTVALGVRVSKQGVYSINATEVNDLSFINLEDTKTGINTDLLKDSYSFSFTPGENEQRFMLHFSTLAVNETAKAIASIYSNSHAVYVVLKDNVKGDIFIYSVDGQLVATAPASHASTIINLKNTGNYIVKVITDQGISVKKVWVQ